MDSSRVNEMVLTLDRMQTEAKLRADTLVAMMKKMDTVMLALEPVATKLAAQQKDTAYVPHIVYQLHQTSR